MTKKKRRPDDRTSTTRSAEREPTVKKGSATAGRPRKPVVYEYRRNFGLGGGMIVFTFAWIALLSPLLSVSGSNKLLGYGLLAVVSIVNWTIVLYALRILPWAPKELSLSRNELIVRTVSGKERTSMRKITGLRLQKNPLFFFTRGLIIVGVGSTGKRIRENVLFSDMGKQRVYELWDDLKRFR